MVIAFKGESFAGKTTMALAASRLLGWPVRSFAEPLKKVCGILGFGKENRTRMILVAEKLKEIDPSIWAKALPGDGDFIVDDLRFHVEEERLRELGDYIVIYVSTSREERVRRSSELAVKDAESAEYELHAISTHYVVHDFNDLVQVLKKESLL